MNKPKVSIVHSTYKTINPAISKTMELLQYKPKKDGIFIKPNLVDMFRPGKAVTTHPKFVEGIIKYFRYNYPDMEIIVGDGSAININYDEVIRKTGFEKLRKKYNFSLVNVNELERKKVKFGDNTVLLPKILDSHEYINVPKMKTHVQTSVSLGAKNQKGLLDNNTKKKFHRDYNLHKSIKLLGDIVKPDLIMTDGILSMEGDGPTDTGDPRKTNLIIASCDLHAHDHVAAICMGFDPGSIEHFKPKCSYEIVGEELSNSVRPHLKPHADFMRVANIYLSITDSMCTQCAITFKTLFDLKLNNLPFLLNVFFNGGFKEAKYVLLGKQPGKIYDIDNTIGFGTCSLKNNPNLNNIKGCPPSLKEMQEKYIEFIKHK